MEFEAEIQQKIENELSLGRISGPYDSPPFENFRCFPLGAREKGDSTEEARKIRMLHNLTFPYDGSSLNENIPKEFTTVKYASFLDAVKVVQGQGPGCFLAKSDISDAFRLLPLHPSQYHLMGFQFKGKFYYDKCLPMGCAASCKKFEEFSDALKWILVNKFGVRNITKILDDFLFCHKIKAVCDGYLHLFLTMCDIINIPVAYHKTETARTSLVFYGIRINTTEMIASLPSDKLKAYTEAVEEALTHKKLTFRELKSVIGKLQFATTVVKPGRAFLRRMHDLTKKSYKPHYLIRLNKDVKSDLRMWLAFMRDYNGVTMIKAVPPSDSQRLHLYADASQSYGYGCTFGRAWFQGRWPLSWQQKNICVLELYPLYMLLHTYSHILKNQKITFHSDNGAVVDVLKSQTSDCKEMMAIIRPLVLTLLQFNITLSSLHVPGKLNIICDFLSRKQATPEFLREHGMFLEATPIQPQLLPENFKGI